MRGDGQVFKRVYVDFYSLLEEHVCFPGTKSYMRVFFLLGGF